MSTNLDFKNIWQQQKVGQPNMDNLLHKLKEFKKSGLQKLIFANSMLVVLIGAIISIWHYYQPQFITTKIGIVLIIIAMVIYLFSYNKLFSIFNKIDNRQTNREYLQSLSAINIRQKFMQTTMLGIYYIMLSIGVCLYMFEYASRMTMLGAIIAYTSTLTWIGFSWFYLRPKTIKKQQSKLDELINKFEAINEQLKAE